MKAFEPMKACSDMPTEAFLQACFNVGIEFWVTDKFDGWRALRQNEGSVTRKLKPIPNIHVRTWMDNHVPVGFDGELVSEGMFNDSQSHFSSFDTVAPFKYHVFDDTNAWNMPYFDRVARLQRFAACYEGDGIMEFELPRIVKDFATLQKEENEAVEVRRREGLILRVPWGLYKFGRSTMNEALMLKLKRWEDAEATIIGYVSLMRNTNTPKFDAFGRQERGHGIDGMVADEMLGALQVYHPEFGTFNVGGPFTELQRCNFWSIRNTLLGRVITFKFQRHGTLRKPRNPKFHCFRMD